MDEDCKTRRQVSVDQMSGLLEYLRAQPELARGLVRGRRGKFHSLELWNKCAKKLNAIEDGACKDGKGWSKYWCDWKYRVRRKALELRAARESDLPPPENITALTEMEDRILRMIGDAAVDAVLIKTDPLTDASMEDADLNENKADISQISYAEPKRSKVGKRRRRRSPPFAEAGDDDDDARTDTTTTRKRRLPTSPDHITHSEVEDEAAEFIRLEEEKLETSRRTNETLSTIAGELRRLCDVIAHVRDILYNNTPHNM